MADENSLTPHYCILMYKLHHTIFSRMKEYQFNGTGWNKAELQTPNNYYTFRKKQDYILLKYVVHPLKGNSVIHIGCNYIVPTSLAVSTQIQLLTLHSCRLLHPSSNGAASTIVSLMRWNLKRGPYMNIMFDRKICIAIYKKITN